jgi:hypothetical protein
MGPVDRAQQRCSENDVGSGDQEQGARGRRAYGVDPVLASDCLATGEAPGCRRAQIASTLSVAVTRRRRDDCPDRTRRRRSAAGPMNRRGRSSSRPSPSANRAHSRTRRRRPTRGTGAMRRARMHAAAGRTAPLRETVRSRDLKMGAVAAWPASYQRYANVKRRPARAPASHAARASPPAVLTS